MNLLTKTHGTILITLVALAAAVGGCASNAQVADPSYRTVSVEPMRNSESAARHNALGLKALEAGDWDAAAEQFAKALDADVKYGPAHNNLGKVHYHHRRWHEAAWEFDHARRLMPRHAGPCNNLALVLEEGGRLDEAVDYYRQAIELDPSAIDYRANLARVLVRRGDRSDELRVLLTCILAKSRSGQWLIWAEKQLAGLEHF